MPPDDRRDPARHAPIVGGKRSTDYTLKTTDCAKKLGVSTRFIRGEIKDRRLKAFRTKGRGRRMVYRISEADLWAYIEEREWSSVTPDGPTAPAVSA